MTRIAVITGSTRPGRRCDAVAQWVMAVAGRHSAVTTGQAEVDLVDLSDFGLPVLDEPLPAMFGQYQHPHTQRWADVVGSYDGFVFVTPEYNHSVPGALKNAIDYLFAEWNDKAAGFVSYGVHGGTRAAEHLRQILGEVKVASVRSQVVLSLFVDFEITDPTAPGILVPGENQEPAFIEMFDEVVAWSRALQPLREAAKETVGV
jgi:NAD(P)H-dependent FMN reductase